MIFHTQIVWENVQFQRLIKSGALDTVSMFKTASPIKETENLEGFFVKNFLHHVDIFLYMKNMGFFPSC